MVELTLDADERQILERALRQHISELRMRIPSTEKKELRDELKRREQTLKSIVATLEEAATEAESPVTDPDRG